MLAQGLFELVEPLVHMGDEQFERLRRVFPEVADELLQLSGRVGRDLGGACRGSRGCGDALSARRGSGCDRHLTGWHVGLLKESVGPAEVGVVF